MRPQDVGHTASIGLRQNPFHRPHAIDELHASRMRKILQYRLRLLLGKSIQLLERRSAPRR
jgi:hypothetical protein